ncbi:MAG: hypothetical protein Aurels2KO_57530 [Aureliella sp.]
MEAHKSIKISVPDTHDHAVADAALACQTPERDASLLECLMGVKVVY